MKQKTGIYLLLSILGIALAIAGIVLLKTGQAEGSNMFGILIGVGSGLFGANIASLIQAYVLKKNPEQARMIEIEQKDERNQHLSRLAKEKAFDTMLYVFSALMLIFVFIGTDLVEILLLTGAYLLVVGVMVFYLVKFSKEQ